VHLLEKKRENLSMPVRDRGARRGTETRATMTVQEAGRKGGNTVKQKYGPEFYSEIGQKGGKKVQEEAKRYRALKEAGKL
jgi:uncharacterized protein